MTRALINALCKGLDAEGWRIVGYGGAWARAIRPVEAYIEKRVAKAVAAEREACAKLCEEECADPDDQFKNYEDTHTDGWMDGCNSCAAAIRARGNNAP